MRTNSPKQRYLLSSSVKILCIVYLSSTRQRQTLTVERPAHFECNDYFMLGGIRTRLGVSSDLMFLWISSNSYPLNLLLIQSHQAEIVIVKRLIQGCNSATGLRV